MSNRSQEENLNLLLDALRKAGEEGLNIDQARDALFGNDPSSKTATKKLLEHLKSKGHLRVKVVKTEVCYCIIPGR